MKKIILLLCFVYSVALFAQKSQADKKFYLYEYSEAIPLYNQHLSKSPKDYDAAKNLALAYKYTNQIDGSIAIYRRLLTLKQAVAEDWYEFVQLLRISGNLAEAKQFALQYKEKNEGLKAQNLIKSIEMYDELIADIDKFDIVNKTAKYKHSVFAPQQYNNKFIVTAEQESGKKSEWTGRGFTKLYLTDISFNLFIPFAPEVMTSLNDGPASISSDGITMYFTTVNKKSLKEQDVDTRKLQISSAVKNNETWEATELFHFNNSSYNVSHPTLKSDGSMLVFTSDMPGGKGKMDLYYCILKQNNVWSEPVNISALNTSENELFPTFAANNTLYFSSNGLPGLGGLDIFSSKNEANAFEAAINLKAPINSAFDDFSLFSSDNLNSGYLSTNRFESTETDDIAYFSKKVNVPVIQTIIKVQVVDKYTSIPLPYVAVSVKDEKNEVVYKGMTDPEGYVIIEDLPADRYKIQGILNDITTTMATIAKDEFSKQMIEKTVTHNDPRFTLAGITINAGTGLPVSEVKVVCENISLAKTTSVITKGDGKFFFQLEQASDFKVMGEKLQWLSSEAIYESTKGLDRSKDLYVKIQLNIQQPTASDVIRLDKIFYDYDKCNIKPRAAEELNRLVKLMNDYPDMVTELSSHTDSRGSAAYNVNLSQCRADAAVAYIVSKGISASRIVPKGFGESRLVNECGDGIECSEAKHQENRRTEFVIAACETCPKQVK